MLPDSAFSASSNSGYSITGSLTNGTTISFYYSLGAASSRLYRTNNGSWVPEHPYTGEYITADLGKAYDVVAVANQGRRGVTSWYLTQFKFLHSMDGENFKYVVDDNDEHYVFSLSHAIKDTVEYNMLPYTIRATHVRLEVVQYYASPTVRWDIFFFNASKICNNILNRDLYICSTCLQAHTQKECVSF